ncbi:hypothetical protein RN001_008114 [Aquatica leii]|uniref:Anoctamin n=1 Tax=Aquatica leii TaxID=1421715 RepID=A0AAN7PAC4_9COLE|nr:hypothetical protein RN001_008114 [Aquatica leii]
MIENNFVCFNKLNKGTCRRNSTLEWIVDKIRDQRSNGGGELLVLKQPYNEKKGVVLHISASKIKFLEAAEEMEIIKCDKSGQQREFTVSNLEDFLPDGMHVDDLLTTAEKQKIIQHELENIRALPEDKHILGYPNYTLYEGQSIIYLCIIQKLIKTIYPLHDNEELKKFGKKWYLTLFGAQPIEQIRLYFGEAIALYFSFLSFYTTALIIPTVLGFLQLFVSKENVPFFCIFNVVWVTVFLEVWRRRSNELAYKWGTIGMTSLDEPRGNFRGHMGIDAVSGKLRPQYPRWKTNAKMYLLSLPLVVLCMAAAFVFMLLQFYCEDYLRALGTPLAQQLLSVPTTVYAIVVYIINIYYRKLATYLTEWENHRTQSQYDRHRVVKLVLFEFVNNFTSLFYIAFVKQDLDVLKNQLATMLIIQQAINNVTESIIPLVLKVLTLRSIKLNTVDSTKHSEKIVYNDKVLTHIPELSIDDSRIQDAEKEYKLEVYETTFDDYLEIYVQFGYVMLFSSVYPLAALWAIINNILEIRSDAFKLCLVYQRPFSRKVKDIGAWQKAFEVIGALSIITNCGLLCLNPQFRKSYYLEEVEWILMFVALEHFLLGLRYLIHIMIPEKPEWVRIALAKKNHESKQALKHEQMQQNRRILARKFKTVHGKQSALS